ncbi:PTR2-domain-containing protein [Coniochaeta ligniaria NRRL 30616]|uniref:PTR2-domain-containing protein n=1 Tax=Coniochaeta ligniaria NRRL 30616 TaxID=1408157 RepID=A0A1J7I8U7_9PEZI|nr:PTR2-domain-containing protein [Coniochaeta ligniaria NRRL 30616]
MAAQPQPAEIEKKVSANALERDVDYPAPTEEERATLRKVADSIPYVSYLLCMVELAERASFYGVKTVFNNFMQFPLPEGGDGSGAVPKHDPNGHAGALGMGLQFASAIGTLFTFLAYLLPIFGAWLADAHIGRYKAIILGVLIGGVAHVIMIGGAAPAVLRAGNGLAPFMISFFLLAIGAGIFKPCVSPTVIDQYTHQREYVKTLKSGERVLVDPETTIGRIMMVFYSCVNIGSFFAIATTYVEKYVGFWVAFLLPGIIYFILPIMLWWMNKRTIKKPAEGSDLANFVKVTWMALKRNKGNVFAKTFWDKARPSALREAGIEVEWTNKFVTDVKRTMEACQIFLYFPIYNINDGGIGASQSNQGASMTSAGAPNDLLSNFNPLTIIVLGPVLSHVVYPLLNKYHIKFGRIDRMTFGFLLAALSGAVGAIVQWRVYKTSPCGYMASSCPEVSPINIWWQIPNVSLGALSELFCNVTAYEMAYARSPPNMKSLVMAFFLFTTALSSALMELLIPVVDDPHLIWVWAGPAIALVVQTAIFWWRHHDLNEDEFMTYDPEEDDEVIAGRSDKT